MYLPAGRDLYTLNAHWNIKELLTRFTPRYCTKRAVDTPQLRAHWAKLDLPVPEGNELSELRAELRSSILQNFTKPATGCWPEQHLTNQWANFLIPQNE
ncbi:hypothetical protein Zmor_028506 [Zophobas morio]|uniref:Uncharacterized protein n=1 Tax=Zophobas morio TaxID=2755281 RepID=A0AA38HJM3_9CUCU|nr:hypothetical protein Zmor_028506 [Zophobas morio]